MPPSRLLLATGGPSWRNSCCDSRHDSGREVGCRQPSGARQGLLTSGDCLTLLSLAKMRMRCRRGTFAPGHVYSLAMIFEGALIVGMLISSTQPRIVVGVEGIGKDGLNARSLAVSFASLVDPGSSSSPTDKTTHESESPNYPPPRITVADPVSPPSPWFLKDRIAWAANLILVILGYAGVMLAISTLRKIERQTISIEEAVSNAAATAEAALLHAQALVRSERPWIMITVEPSPDIEYSSNVVATNRGKSPAKLIAAADRIVSVIDEADLPSRPEYESGQPRLLPVPIILLPGECAEIKIFTPEDVKRFCASEEKLKRVQDWEERLFVYGKVIYRNLIAPDDQQVHETSWCCWYVAGKTRSGLVSVSIPAFK